MKTRWISFQYETVNVNFKDVGKMLKMIHIFKNYRGDSQHSERRNEHSSTEFLVKNIFSKKFTY